MTREALDLDLFSLSAILARKSSVAGIGDTDFELTKSAVVSMLFEEALNEVKK